MKNYPIPHIPLRTDFSAMPFCPGCGLPPATAHQLFWAFDTDPDSCHFSEFGVATQCQGRLYFYFLPDDQELLGKHLQRTTDRLTPTSSLASLRRTAQATVGKVTVEIMF